LVAGLTLVVMSAGSGNGRTIQTAHHYCLARRVVCAHTADAARGEL